MISEGVDIPRLRVGVFASNVVSELYFRQFCGRFVRTGDDPRERREAYVYLPDDVRLRALAGRITLDVRRALKAHAGEDEVARELAAAQREDRTSDGLGEYASIAATSREGRVLDYGPLFNPHAFAAAAAASPAGGTRTAAAEPVAIEEPIVTHAERRDDLRRELRGLVARASIAFGVDHKRIHASLNQRFGGQVATATVAGLESRRKLLTTWLERRVYDGLR